MPNGEVETIDVTLELERLSKQVGGQVHLHDISLKFESDSFNVLLGPTHAGKTSLLRLIAGLDRPSSGCLFLNGEDITTLEVRQRSIAFVYQDFVNYPTLSVFENIASPMRVRSEDKQTIDGRVCQVANLLGIDSVLDRLPPSLSGGQQQRVAIARALVKYAEVILLDEPLANLDYKLREDLRRELPRLLGGLGRIVLYASSDPTEAFLLGGNTIVIDKGAVSQVGPASEIFSSPDNLSAASILSDIPINLLAATIENDSCRLADDFSLPVPAHMRSLSDGAYTLGIRAEHVQLEAVSPAAVPCAVRVTVTEITGNETIIHFELARQSCVAIVAGTQKFESARSMTLFLNLDALFVFDDSGKTVASPAGAGRD